MTLKQILNNIKNVKINIDSHVTFTDSNGFFRIAIPINEQTICKKISVEKEGFIPIVKSSECPSSNIGYILKEK